MLWPDVSVTRYGVTLLFKTIVLQQTDMKQQGVIALRCYAVIHDPMFLRISPLGVTGVTLKGEVSVTVLRP